MYARSIQSILLATAVVLLLGCRSDPQEPVTPLLGVWSSEVEDVRFVASEKEGRVQFYCASGWTEQAIFVDANGRFRTGGTFSVGPVGPILDTLYLGHVDGERLFLEIEVQDPSFEVMRYTLESGDLRIRPCQ